MTGALAPAPPRLETPYKGLTYYSEGDAPYFFGRESETEIIIANLMASRLTLLYGESGVGKSSVLHAGAMRRLHQLARQNLADFGQPDFVAVSFRNWQNDPIAGLRDAIRTTVAEVLPDVEPVEPKERLDEELFEWCERIDGDLILVLDQFEEYFLYHPSEGGPGSFALEFPRSLNRPDLRVSFLIGIREDGLAKLDAFKGRIPNLFDNYLRIDHLSLKAARTAIESPIRKWNELHQDDADVDVEDGLVEAVLEQVRAGQFFLGTGGAGTVVESKNGRGNVIETPFLQLVMTRLWEEELGSGSHVLRRETLDRLGGAERIVRTHLDRVMGALPAEEQDLAADVFRQLVTPSGAKIAHALPDLAEYAERPEADIVPVIEHLSSSDIRVLRPVAPPPGETGGLRYEIFHDVLAAAILDWRTRYVQAEKERELQESLAEQERERRAAEEQAARERRRARISMALAALAIVGGMAAALLGVWAWQQKNTAQRERATAKSQGLAATAIRFADFDPRLATALAVHATDIRATAPAEDALRISLSVSLVRRILRGHANWINSAVYSPDGTRILTTSDDKTARIWDVRTGKARILQPNPDFVVSGVFSPDGRRVVTASGKTFRIWDEASGKPIFTQHQPDYVSSVAISPNGRYIATTSSDGMARVWSADGKRQIVSLKHERTVNGTVRTISVLSAAFSPDGRYLLTGTVSPDNKGRVWDWRAKRVVSVEQGNIQSQVDSITSVAYSPDGKHAATGSSDKTIAVWAPLTGHQEQLLYGHKDEVLGVAFSPNSRLLASASKDGGVRLWDYSAGTGERLTELRGHEDWVSGAAFSPDGRFVLSASKDGTAAIWQVPPVRELLGHTDWVTWASYSADGNEVVTSSDDDTARIWDVKTGRTLHVLGARHNSDTSVGHTDWLTSASFSADGRLVATSSDDNTARLWDAHTGKMLKVLEGHGDWLTDASFSPDGGRLATSSLDQTVRIWDTRTGKTVKTLDSFTRTIETVVFSPNGRYLLTASDDRTARVWNWQTGKIVKTLSGHLGSVYQAVFSPDSRLVATASTDGTARVWRWRTSDPPLILRGHTQPVTSVAFSPDGTRLVTGSADRITRFWEVASGKLLGSVRWHADTIESVAFSPDGQSVLSASDDRTAKVYACDTCESVPTLLATARARVQRTVLPGEIDPYLR